MAARGVLAELRSWARFLVPSKYCAVYYPTAPHVATRMLQLAKVQPEDVVYDLGCGDGRIVVAAARDFGARAVGVELDAGLVAAAAANVERAGVADRVTIVHGDAAAADVSTATVIALYMSDSGNRRLLRALAPALRPGTRVVSLVFGVEGWAAHRVALDTTVNMPIHLYEYRP